MNGESGGPEGDPGIRGIHHIEIFVENTSRAAHFYESALGFRLFAKREADTDRTSIALRTGETVLVLTGPRGGEGPVARYLDRHGEGIKDIALRVGDLAQVLYALSRSNTAVVSDTSIGRENNGFVRFAQVKACGDLVHTLIDSAHYVGAFLPHYETVNTIHNAGDMAVAGLDHVAIAVEAGELDRWVDFYVRALGFCETHQEQVSTEYSAMRSKVVQTPDGTVRFPMMEPAHGKRKSQIDNFITAYNGPGAQHLTFLSTDIVHSVTRWFQPHQRIARAIGIVPGGSWFVRQNCLTSPYSHDTIPPANQCLFCRQ